MQAPIAVECEGEPVNGVAPTAQPMTAYLDVTERLRRGDKSIPPTLFVDAVYEALRWCEDRPIEGDCGCLG